MSDPAPPSALRRRCAGLFCVLALGAAVAASAQEVDFQPLADARDCVALLPVGDRVYGGLTTGGVLVWDAAEPSAYTRWTTADGLGGHRVSALAYSGRHLWVATTGTGLTRVTLGDDGPGFRQYANLGGRDIVAVAGILRGAGEVIYYGLRESGLGVINDGLPGAVFTQQDHGLVDDRIMALAFFQGELWVGTQGGVSRFAANVFTTHNAGLPDLRVQALLAPGDTLLFAGTFANGVARWSPAAEAWAPLPGLSGRIASLAWHDGSLWALRDGEGVAGRLWRWDGALWTEAALPEPLARVIAGGDRLWTAGMRIEPGMSGGQRTGRAFLAAGGPDAWSSWQTDELLYTGVDGVGFGPDGSLWLGSRDGVGVSRCDPSGRWEQLYEVASAANDSLGLFAHGPNVLSLVVLPDGEVWFTQFDVGGGVARVRPGAGGGIAGAAVEHLTPLNSGLATRRVVRIVRHPDGPLLFCSDQSGVDVLLEPSRWREPAQWLRLPVGAAGLGGGTVRDALVARRDQIWFTVSQVGLVRWDVNGGAGADDPLTWNDSFDDLWYPPLTSLTGTTFELGGARGLARGEDGSIWAGGPGGVVRFQPGVSGGGTLLNAYRKKGDAFASGLLSDTVTDIEIDANGDLWAALDVGLNRVRLLGGTTAIDAYVDLAALLALDTASLYSPAVISGLPGGQVFELAAEPGGRRLLVGAAGGAALLWIAPPSTAGERPLDRLFVYPNPYAGGGLKLGGYLSRVVFSPQGLSGGAAVTIYNLEGQVVHRNAHVANDVSFWDGVNLAGEPAASGIYVIKVELDGQTVVKSLAVER